jgi:hypothetical protein
LLAAGPAPGVLRRRFGLDDGTARRWGVDEVGTGHTGDTWKEA